MTATRHNFSPSRLLSFARSLRILAAVFFPLLMISPQALAIATVDAYRTVSTLSPRPMAMGGAFISVRDDLAALIWNPASFVLYQKDVSHRISVHLNPIVSAALLYKDHRDMADFLAALGTAVKGVTYSHRWADVGLILWEEPLWNPLIPADGRFFRADHIIEQYFHSLGLHVRLAPTVSLGGTSTLYRIQKADEKSVLAGGFNYGVLLQPARGIEIGLAHFDFPSSLAHLRSDLEGIEDESVNAGVSWRPDGQTLLAMDLRDASGDEKIGWSRFRFGFERIFQSCLAFRLGYFQIGNTEGDVYSFGLGLFWPGQRSTGRTTFGYLANYALLVEKDQERQRHWHLLSLLFTI